MAERIFTVLPGTSINNVQLGFYATSLIVNNPTAYWYHLPDQNVFIHPFTNNQVISLSGTQTATVLFQPPLGITQTVSGDNSPATFRYTDSPLAPTVGYGGYSGIEPGVNITQLFTLGNNANRTHRFPYALPQGFGLYIPLDTLAISAVRVAAQLPSGIALPNLIRSAIQWTPATGYPETTLFLRYRRPLPAQTALTVYWREATGGNGTLRYAIAT